MIKGLVFFCDKVVWRDGLRLLGGPSGKFTHYTIVCTDHFIEGILKFTICICVSDEPFVKGKPHHGCDHPCRVCAQSKRNSTPLRTKRNILFARASPTHICFRSRCLDLSDTSSAWASVCRVGRLRNLVCRIPRQCAFFRYPPIGGSLLRNGAAGVITELVGLWMPCIHLWYNFASSTLGI